MSIKLLQKTFAEIDQKITRAFSFLLITGGIVMTLTVVLQVLLRYVFKVPLFGLEEFSRLVAIWIYFMGAVFSTRDDNHVQGGIADNYIAKERSRLFLRGIVWAICLFTCGLFLYHSGTYSLWIYGTGERTTGLWWPRIISVSSMFFGAVFMTAYSLANTIKYLTAAINYKDNRQQRSIP
jgi:TRAP-type C4-dicarboxylate transport system permease small subunit